MNRPVFNAPQAPALAPTSAPVADAPRPDSSPTDRSRRKFLQQGTASVVGVGALGSLAIPRMAHAAGDETIRIGLVGCGGRGSGAAINALGADSQVKLTAMGDLFADRLQDSRRNIQNEMAAADQGTKVAVDDDHCFVGFDAYQQVINSGVDVVLLASPPHFRPAHLEAAIAAGKHVFCEKPVAVDAPGVRRVLATVRQAREKNLSIVSGLCWRYDLGVRETIQRIKDGAIGDLVAIHTNYLAGTLWQRTRKPEWSEMEYQIRNWLYYTWLSGDHIVEQHVHSLDKCLWLMNDQLPARCFGLGGRQVRTEEVYGNIYDHHAVCYEYPNGLKVFAYTRQMQGCFNEVDDFVYGTQGNAVLLQHKISGPQAWTYQGPKPSMYDVEHQELFAGIRAGKHLNNGEYMSYSTMMAIMGRMACYTGEIIEGEKALNSTEDLTPPHLEFKDLPRPEVAMPGRTKFV